MNSRSYARQENIDRRGRSAPWMLRLCTFTIAALLIAAPTKMFGQSTTVSADFGSRSTAAYPIPANFLGVGLGGGVHPAILQLMSQAGLNYTRLHANVQDTYQTATPNWSELDGKLSAIQGSGLQVILEVDYTPASLQPSPNPCPNGTAAYHAFPTDLNAFAAMATAYVHHINANFPGVVTDYEIWNEPDGGGLCSPSNTQAEKLSEYLQIYASVAPAIAKAAAEDGVSVSTGGPTLGGPVGNASSWIPALLNDSRTAPYVDFVSFHYYVTGTNQVEDGLTWDGTGGTPSLLAMTQSQKRTGFANVYQSVAALVQSGSQPNAGTTPIYMDEYNSDWAFLNDCCRNDPTYSPVWNTMVFADLLNTVYSGAFEVPSRVLYYSASNHPFCIAGNYDAAMDCVYPSDALPMPYPQYYALQLFSSAAYLGLQNGGYMAQAVASSDPNLITTAFWTSGGNAIVIINPTGNDYAGVSIAANHPNVPSAQGTEYLLNSSNPSITTQTVSAWHTPTGYGTVLEVPPYSVVAFTLTQ